MGSASARIAQGPNSLTVKPRRVGVDWGKPIIPCCTRRATGSVKFRTEKTARRRFSSANPAPIPLGGGRIGLPAPQGAKLAYTAGGFRARVAGRRNLRDELRLDAGAAVALCLLRDPRVDGRDGLGSIGNSLFARLVRVRGGGSDCSLQCRWWIRSYTPRSAMASPLVLEADRESGVPEPANLAPVLILWYSFMIAGGSPPSPSLDSPTGREANRCDRAAATRWGIQDEPFHVCNWDCHD